MLRRNTGSDEIMQDNFASRPETFVVSVHWRLSCRIAFIYVRLFNSVQTSPVGRGCARSAKSQQHDSHVRIRCMRPSVEQCLMRGRPAPFVMFSVVSNNQAVLLYPYPLPFPLVCPGPTPKCSTTSHNAMMFAI